MATNGDLDYAIIGAGVSGVYCAWKLLENDRNLKITVFDADDHVGGRLLSVSPPGIPDMVAELGGMRILPAVQPLIGNLIKVLNATAKPGQQIDTYDFPVDQPQNIAYLRGVYLRLAEFTTKPDKVPYRLNFLEHGQTSGSILTNAIEQIVPSITNPKLTEEERREMTQNAEFDGVPLYKQGFWNVLMRVISGEAYQFGVDSGGYESTLSNWNAADAIPWFLADFGVSSKYQAFKKGFIQVPQTLAERFRKLGGRIECDTKVTGFRWENDGFDIDIEKGRTVRAKKLILAMPRRALDLIAPGAPLLQAISRLISSVTPRPLFKVFTTYSSPWWRNAGYTDEKGTYIPVQSGRTTTDLPVRQTYYWPKNDGSPATQGRSMLMASYDDGTNISYWDGYRDKRGIGWRLPEDTPRQERFLGEANRAFAANAKGESDPGDCLRHPEWTQYPAPARMVPEVERQLALIHGLSFVPQPIDAAYKDWGDDPFGGGWNNWNIGVKSWEVKKKIVHPYDGSAGGPKIPLYICGEAYSDAQGWVEGALQTADMVLARIEEG